MAKKLRVLMIGTSPAGRGGVATLAQMMLQEGHADITIDYLASHQSGGRVRAGLCFLKAWLVLPFLLWRVHLVHLHLSKEGSCWRKYLLLHWVWLFSKPYLLHCHSGGFADFYTSLPSQKREKINGMFAKAAGVMTVSRHWKDYYLRQFHLLPERVKVLRNMVRPALPVARNNTQPQPYLLYLGLIHATKGAFDLLDAYSLLPASTCPDLVLAGNGNIDEAKAYAQKLGVAEKVHFSGWVAGEEKAALLAGATALCLPSHAEAGVPFVVMEALAAGVPVVVSDVTGMRELLTDGDNALLVPVSDSKALAGRLTALLEDEAKQQHLRLRGKQLVQQHSPDMYMHQLVAFYRQLLA